MGLEHIPFVLKIVRESSINANDVWAVRNSFTALAAASLFFVAERKWTAIERCNSEVFADYDLRTETEQVV